MELKLKDFDELGKRDFENAAVTDAIRQVIVDRDKLKSILANLVDLYVANIGTGSELIFCITPNPAEAEDMNYFERRNNKTWSAWDAARAVLGGKYTTKKDHVSKK